MTGMTEWVAGLGGPAAQMVWEPVLVWTVAALAVLGVLRMFGGLHPEVQEKARTALLLALPVSVLLAAMGWTGWVPLPRQPLVLPDWVAVSAPMSGAGDVGPVAISLATPEAEAGALPPAPFWWGLVLLTALAVSAARTVHTILALTALRRLTRRLRFVPPEELGLDPASRCARGRLERVRFAVAAGDVVPMTFGVLRPVVVVSNRLLPDRQGLRMALAHELAHVRRRDPLVHALEHLVSLVFAIHPLVHRLRAGARRYREMACDAEVLGRTRCDPRAYAELLLRLTDTGGGGLEPALSVGGSFTELKTRIETMSRHSRDVSHSRRARRTGALVGGSLLLLTLAAVACTDAIVAPATEGEVHGEVTFSHAGFDGAIERARKSYDGRLLVYFDGADPDVTDRVESHLFGNAEHAGFFTDMFARYAVPVESEEGLAIMERYRVTSHVSSPLLMVVDGDRAVLMTTLAEVTSPASALRKLNQVRTSIELAPWRAASSRR